MSSDSLGNRIKGYEETYRRHLTRRMPVIVRIDGRSFHSFTKDFNRPFDRDIISSMVCAAKVVAEDMQGFKLAYIQSDEASFLLTDYDDINTQGWFNYNHDKIISISASIMSVAFNNILTCLTNVHGRELAVFDSRAFNVPREDVANYFRWRQIDWIRNSLNMYCMVFFSHKELQKKSQSDRHEMLYNIDKNWSKDLLNVEKNGTFLIKTDSGIAQRDDIIVNYESFSKILLDLKVL